MAKEKEEFIDVEKIIQETRDVETPAEMVEKGWEASGDQKPTQTFFEVLWEFLFGKK